MTRPLHRSFDRRTLALDAGETVARRASDLRGVFLDEAGRRGDEYSMRKGHDDAAVAATNFAQVVQAAAGGPRIVRRSELRGGA